MQNTKEQIKEQTRTDFDRQLEHQPDEAGGVHIIGHIKIFDPESKSVFVNKREDD